jgi:uncharacterized phosphatase
MFEKKDFYFVRHGQTDYNLLTEVTEDYPGDMPLNQTGRKQAEAIKPLIQTLPFDGICASPLLRAQETKSIITQGLLAPHHEIGDLKECTLEIWNEMTLLSLGDPAPSNGPAKSFFDQVERGLRLSLQRSKTPLVVAHGGVHWALCYLLSISEHEWEIDNCGVVQFSFSKLTRWTARRL